MKYYIDYQYMPKGAARPLDEGDVVAMEANDSDGFALIPNVGDFVSIGATDEHASFKGRVRSRLFHYQRVTGDIICAVNIVVEETDADWGNLIKE